MTLEARRAASRARSPASGSAWRRTDRRRPREDAAAVVVDGRRLAVHDARRAHDVAAEAPRRSPGGRGRRRGSGIAPGEALDQRRPRRRPRCGVHGPGRDDDAVGRAAPRSRRRVIASLRRTSTSAPELAEVLDEVVGERVVVVDHQEHARSSQSLRHAAPPAAAPRALFTHSACSRSGSESATMPAPACT